jgi:pantoate--beta-alanine ligase
MQLVHTISDLRARLAQATNVALVPTMGNLHDGHLALIHRARSRGQPVVASVFVNPLQFGQGEDFERYPRTLSADAEKLAAAGCDLVFAPDFPEMYPEPQTVLVQPPLADELCGAFRPGHFAGVCTVVLKLFEIVRPRYSVFGKKDYQQLFLIKTMVRQLNLPIEVLEGETIRAADGLALSSRNGYLTAAERAEAPRLHAELRRIADSVASGDRNVAALESAAVRRLSEAGWRVDYVSVRSQATLLPPDRHSTRLVVLGAAWLNTTRLIDNIEASTP